MSELFTVKLPTGHEQRYSLDELDAAYKGGFIDERTLVLPAGSARWVTLGELAGIEEEPASASPASISPMAIDAVDVPIEFDAPLGRASALSSSEIPAELRPRKAGKIFGVAIALVAVVGIGVAATRGASTIKSATASLKARVVSAEAPKAAAAMQAPAAETKLAETRQGTSTTSTTTTTPAAPTLTTDKLPNAAPASNANVPTMNASSLPDAKDKKTKAKRKK